MASCKTAVLRTGRMVDTSPPIWELRSARQRRNVYERELVVVGRLASPRSFRARLAFTLVNGKASLGALGVNMLTRNAFRNCSNTATGGPFVKKHE
jgi:hypothetical protein